MKIFKFFILILLLAACQPKPEIIHDSTNTLTNDKAKPTDSQTASHGTIAGGGGNGINDRPLESYKIEWASHIELEKNILEVIRNVAESSPKLAADLMHIKRHRIWYLVPIELDQIPGERIGVYFKTDQEAIQNYAEIWLSDLSFPKTVADQTALILHELSLGVYVLENSGGLDHCLALAARSLVVAKPAISYMDARSECFEKFKDEKLKIDVGQRRIDLSDNDYKSIRYLSTMLIESKGKLDSKNIETELKTKGFQLF
jgi:hypothetical protein